MRVTSSGIILLQTKSWALPVSAIDAISADALRCWQGIQVRTDAMATAYITVTCKVAPARFSMQLPKDSWLQHLCCKYGITFSCFDRIFTSTIVLCDANWIVSSVFGMAWIQIAIMLDGNFVDFNVVPKWNNAIGCTWHGKMLVVK